ncbi:CoA ester lyase [Dactylosporangium maewongense]|uniref:CoA ester lyase n=1 Tax=Dactylosporangium maewongense TaxID=634393 RepID=A0ABP4N8Z4_9ACTN
MDPFKAHSPAPELTALYVPADRPDRHDKALATIADVVIVDLEDAVAPSRKDAARREVVDLLRHRSSGSGTARLCVRVNPVSSPWGRADLEALAEVLADVTVHSIRLPKVESAQDVDSVRACFERDVPVSVLVETAVGVERLGQIAAAHGVASVALGEADLRSDLRLTGDGGLDWVRSRLVVAARAAGLPPPMMSVHPRLNDDEGLLRSCAAGRAAGFLGRTAVHPRQLPLIVEGFAPEPAQVEKAESLLAALARGRQVAAGVVVLPDGQMADAAMAAAAEHVVAVHQRVQVLRQMCGAAQA